MHRAVSWIHTRWTIVSQVYSLGTMDPLRVEVELISTISLWKSRINNNTEVKKIKRTFEMFFLKKTLLFTGYCVREIFIIMKWN